MSSLLFASGILREKLCPCGYYPKVEFQAKTGRGWAPLGRGFDQRIDTTFLSRFSLIADTDRLPVAACWMCSLHQAIIGRLRSI